MSILAIGDRGRLGFSRRKDLLHDAGAVGLEERDEARVDRSDTRRGAAAGRRASRRIGDSAAAERLDRVLVQRDVFPRCAGSAR